MTRSATVPSGGVPPTTGCVPIVRLACHVHYRGIEVLWVNPTVGSSIASRQGNDVAGVDTHLVGELIDSLLELGHTGRQCCVRAWRA